MRTTETLPVDYAAFYDFIESASYSTSAGEVANEISNRYNNFDKMKEAIETQLQIIEALISNKRIVNLDESIAYYKQLLESLK